MSHVQFWRDAEAQWKREKSVFQEECMRRVSAAKEGVVILRNDDRVSMYQKRRIFRERCREEYLVHWKPLASSPTSPFSSCTSTASTTSKDGHNQTRKKEGHKEESGSGSGWGVPLLPREREQLWPLTLIRWEDLECVERFHPYITDLLDLYPDLHWNWHRVSANPYLRARYVCAHPEHPWHFSNLAANLELSLDVVQWFRHQQCRFTLNQWDKKEKKVVDILRLVENPSFSWPLFESLHGPDLPVFSQERGYTDEIAQAVSRHENIGAEAWFAHPQHPVWRVDLAANPRLCFRDVPRVEREMPHIAEHTSFWSHLARNGMTVARDWHIEQDARNAARRWFAESSLRQQLLAHTFVQRHHHR